MNMDALIDFCVASGEVSGTSTLEYIGQSFAAPLSVCMTAPVQTDSRRNPWTAEETAFVRDHLGTMTLAEIGAAIGRSENAVKIRIVRKQIPVASKRPGYLTGHQLAKLFRVDVHAVMAWKERGIMDIDTLPGNREIMSVHIDTVYRWAVKWENWIYFKVERLRDTHLRRLVELAQKRWGDEWWTIGQVARYHGISSNAINARIRRGSVPAKQWGNWYMRKSDAVAMNIRPGKGSASYLYGNWSPLADAWILRAVDELGMTFRDIAPRMKGVWNEKRVSYRYRPLKEMDHE